MLVSKLGHFYELNPNSFFKVYLKNYFLKKFLSIYLGKVRNKETEDIGITNTSHILNGVIMTINSTRTEKAKT